MLLTNGDIPTTVPKAGTPQEYPYEIHLSVRYAEPNMFRTACHLIGLKPLFLDLQTRTGTTVMRDVMGTFAAKAPAGQFEIVATQAEQKMYALYDYGFTLVRTKVETVPWHPDVPFCIEEGRGYFEAHVQVFVQEALMPEIRQIAKEQGAHISRNIFKAGPSPDVNIYMLTLRNYTSPSAQSFASQVDLLLNALTEDGFGVRKYEVEYCILDTNHTHDAEWLMRP